MITTQNIGIQTSVSEHFGIDGRRLEGRYADDLVSENGGEGCFSVLVSTSYLLDYTCHDSTLKIKKTLIFKKDEYLLYTVWPQYKLGEGKFWLKYKRLPANAILQLHLFSRNQRRFSNVPSAPASPLYQDWRLWKEN